MTKDKHVGSLPTFRARYRVIGGWGPRVWNVQVTTPPAGQQYAPNQPPLSQQASQVSELESVPLFFVYLVFHFRNCRSVARCVSSLNATKVTQCHKRCPMTHLRTDNTSTSSVRPLIPILLQFVIFCGNVNARLCVYVSMFVCVSIREPGVRSTRLCLCAVITTTTTTQSHNLVFSLN